MAAHLRSLSLAWQPLHPQKEGLLSLAQRYCVEWVELTHKHTLHNALQIWITQKLTLNEGGRTLQDVWSRWGERWSTMLQCRHCYTIWQLQECIFSLRYACSFRTLCHLIGATSESWKSDSCNKLEHEWNQTLLQWLEGLAHQTRGHQHMHYIRLVYTHSLGQGNPIMKEDFESCRHNRRLVDNFIWFEQDNKKLWIPLPKRTVVMTTTGYLTPSLCTSNKSRLK